MDYDRLADENGAAPEHAQESEAGESFRITDPDLVRLEQLADSDFASGAPPFCRELIRHAMDLGQQREFAAAANYTKRALALFDQMDADLRRRHRGDYAQALGVHGTLLMDSGQLDEGRSFLIAALAAYGEMDPVDPLLWDGKRSQALHNLANLFAKQGEFPDALRYARAAGAAAAAYGDQAAEDLVAQYSLALATEAKLLNELGQHRDALAAAEDAARGFAVLANRSPSAAMDLVQLGLELTEQVQEEALPELAGVFAILATFYAESGREDDAIVFAERAVRLLRMLPQSGQTRLQLAASLGNYASLLDQSGDRRAAIEQAREACELAEQCVAEAVAGAAPVLWSCVFNLAVDLLNDGQAAEAQQVAEDALPRIDSSSAEEAQWVARLRDVAEAASGSPEPT